MAKNNDIDQHKRMAMGESIEGEPSFGCQPCSVGSVKFGRKAAETPAQKLPGFPGPMDPPYNG